ncbi:hypothetical protein HDF26_003126 [Pedobacter cryoconitis]|uniref:hypothetical protein n=1 Tax=Pedobacter cryoconitis TaxID=188932 RepID=UPI00161B997F|nr:hypothetical protein [Pedobacter cryoconitis]MBB6272669.1 hypothetical protein [Pedobacter cryoconitis]
MKLTTIILILLTPVLNSCGSNNSLKHQKALEKALKEKYGAESVSITESKENENAVMSVNINFKTLVNPDDIRLIGSSATLLLYNDLNNKEKQEFSLLRTTVEIPSGKSDVMEYKISDLKETAADLKFNDNFFDLLKKKNYKQIQPLFWSKILPEADKVITIYEKLCGTQGQISKIELLGFNYVVKTDASSGAKVPVFIGWYAVYHGTTKNEYKLSFRNDTRQVIAFAINES